MNLDDKLEMQYVLDIKWHPTFNIHVGIDLLTRQTRKVNFNEYDLVGEYKNYLLYERQRPVEQRSRV